MKNLIYFPKNAILGWIAGYTADDNTSLVLAKIKALQECAEQFAQVSGVPIEKIHTCFMSKSSRYKNMRVMYADHNGENLPEGATVAHKDRSLWDHLTD